MTMAMASLLVEKDALEKLKADPGVVGLVPSAQIYPIDPQSEPIWPFIIPSEPQGLPLDAACVRGATINFGLSAFTRGRKDGGALVETARDHAARIGDAIEKALNRSKSILPGVGTVTYTLADIRIFRDGAEPGARHYSATVRARVLGAV